MIKSAFKSGFDPAAHDHAYEIGVAVDAIDGGIRIKINDGYVENDDLPRLWIVPAMDEKTLIFIPEIISKDAIYLVACLFDDELGEVVVVHAGQFHVGLSIPGSRGRRILGMKI
jgi:hypothetical protein